MALIPETQYPGKVAPSTPSYPYGAARNITLPGDGTGTPWDAALVNDLFGFQQTLLSESDTVPSGSPEKVGASQYLQALQKLGLTLVNGVSLGAYATDVEFSTASHYVAYLRSGDIEFYKPVVEQALPYVASALMFPDPAYDANLEKLSYATEAAFNSKVGYDYTVIRNDVAKFAASMTQRAQDAKIVVTGGSVSWNGFGYPAGWGVSGGGYATDAPFGLSSWPNLIRDFWVASHPDFIPVEKLNITTDAALGVSTSARFFGLNTKALKATFTNTSQSLVIDNKTQSDQFLIVSYSSENFGSRPAIIDVNGVEHDTSSPDDLYEGRGYFLIPVGSDTSITIDNVRDTSGGAVTAGGTLYVYGVTGEGSPDFKITGKGGYSSADILAEYGTLVAPYAPNFVIYMVGGNDSVLGQEGIPGFKQNLRDFVALVRADEPDAVIVLSGATPNTGVARDVSLTYNRAMRQVADELGVSMVDMYSRLEHIDTDYWMHDYTHFNKNGDTLVFNVMKSLLFPQVDVPREHFNPSREDDTGLNLGFFLGNPARPTATFLATIQASAVAPTVTMLNGEGITAVYSGSGATSVMVVSWPAGTNLASSLPFLTSGSVSIQVKQSTTATSAEFIAVDAAGSQVDIIGVGRFVRVLALR